MLVLRRIEARMRTTYEGRAISSLPTDELARQRFARCAGYTDREARIKTRILRAKARAVFDQIIAETQ